MRQNRTGSTPKSDCEKDTLSLTSGDEIASCYQKKHAMEDAALALCALGGETEHARGAAAANIK